MLNFLAPSASASGCRNSNKNPNVHETIPILKSCVVSSCSSIKDFSFNKKIKSIIQKFKNSSKESAAVIRVKWWIIKSKFRIIVFWKKKVPYFSSDPERWRQRRTRSGIWPRRSSHGGTRRGAGSDCRSPWRGQETDLPRGACGRQRRRFGERARVSETSCSLSPSPSACRLRTWRLPYRASWNRQERNYPNSCAETDRIFFLFGWGAACSFFLSES